MIKKITLIRFLLTLFIFLDIFATKNHEKWIVVTSIQYPTEALKKLARIKEWQLLVIGDKKTPLDWYLDDRCIYLSPEDQENLSYELCNVLPWNHYARKNIGYLYAIDHGATQIYETDDDNHVISDDIRSFRHEPFVTLESDNPVINVYSYFGQPTMWPRGYPLSYINKSHEFSIVDGCISKKIVIEQGLINKEPDLDALFRLSRRDNTDIYFDDKKNACVLQDRKFCPFNTQNTLFHKEAFWGLYIPSYVPFRVCDIWRGYITQRLLWETDLIMCFTPPTAIQERNVHDFMKDFEDEQDLYLKSLPLINFLMAWKPEKSQNEIFIKCEQLYKELMLNDYIGKKEAILIHAWNNDLKKILNKRT